MTWKLKTTNKLQTILYSDCKVDGMIDEQSFFDQPVNHKLMTYDNIPKIATGQGDDYITGCLLHYDYF